MFSYKVQAGELITAVPYLLGAQPRDEVVLLGEKAARLATITALPVDGMQLIELTVRAFARSGISSCIVIGFSDRDDVVAPLIHAARVATHVGIATADILIVSGDQWVAHTDHSPDTHAVPPAGRLAAELVGLGFAVTGRSTARQPDLVSVESLAAVDTHITELLESSTVAEVCATAREVMHHATNESYPDAWDTASLILATTSPAFRIEANDLVLGSASPRALADLWWWVTRHALGPITAPAAVTCALAAWVCGDLDRAETAAAVATSTALAWPAGIYTGRLIASTRAQARDANESE